MRIAPRLLGMMLAVLVVSACSSSNSVVTEPRSSTDVVVDYYSAVNSSDPEAAATVWPTIDTEGFLVLTQGVSQRVSVSCSPGEEAGLVVCEELVIRNDFTGPAGVRGEYTMSYVVEDGVIVAREIVSASDAVADYEADFGAWLETAHPNVHGSSYQGDRSPPLITVADARVIIVLVPEFLEQSADYPLGE